MIYNIFKVTMLVLFGAAVTVVLTHTPKDQGNKVETTASNNSVLILQASGSNSNSKVLKNYQVMFPKAIQDSSQFIELYGLLAVATEDDVITINIQGFGGRIDVLFELVTLIKQSKAKVVMNVTGNVSSAHAVLAVYGDELKVNPYATFMFHHSSFLNITDEDFKTLKEKKDRGISQELKERESVKQSLKDFLDFLVDMNILTPEELIKVMDGHDVLIEAEIIKARFNKQLKG